MDRPQYTTFIQALSALDDPRKARGRRYPWLLLLTLLALALASGQRSVHGLADWIALHWDELQAELHPARQTCPSESTCRRALRLIDPERLEALLANVGAPVTAPTPLAVPPRRAPSAAVALEAAPGPLQGQAVDGKELRGARAHGAKVHLVSLVRQADAVTLAQTAVDQKSNEITAVPRLLAERDLSGTVTTMDALLTQRRLAQQIRRQHGHYLMVVKENQPELYQAIALLFARPPWTQQERRREYKVYTYENRGHGRLEHRCLEASTSLNTYLDWPDVGQVLRRTCRRRIRKTGLESVEVHYGITSLTPQEASIEQVEAWWRDHWTIENRVHYVRDVTLGEDACQVHVGQTPRVLAALRDMLLNLMRGCGWRNISDAVRHYGARVANALGLLSGPLARL